MAYFLKAMLFGDSVPGFPFSPDSDGAAAKLEGAFIPWTLRPGTSDVDGTPVTLFSVVLADCSPSYVPMVRNVLSQSKRLRLPGVLRCFGGAEHNGVVHVAMERCEPLSRVLPDEARRRYFYGAGELTTTTTTTTTDPANGSGSSSSSNHNVRGGSAGAAADGGDKQRYLDGVTLGLRAVGGALSAMHKNNLFHGNVSADVVYVVDGGLWRLWGLEMLSPCTAPGAYCEAARSVVPPSLLPQHLLDQLSSSAPSSVDVALLPMLFDSFGFGTLIYETLLLRPGSDGGAAAVLSSNASLACFSERRSRGLEELRHGATFMPSSLKLPFSHLMDAVAARQFTVTRFMDSCAFISQSQYVARMGELEELALWDPTRRVEFMSQLTADIPRFPFRACLVVVLPKLLDSLKIGTAASSVTPAVLAVAGCTPGGEDFDRYVTPAIVALYAARDPVARHQLLVGIAQYGGRIGSKPLNEQVWPHFRGGFASTAGNVRDHTARALVTLAPRLSASVMSTDVLQGLRALQQDGDSVIRANATITLSLVADYIPAEMRARTLLSGFTRVLGDKQLPVRLAGLRALVATLHHYPLRVRAASLMPGLAPLALDPEAEVRQLSLDILRKCMTDLEANHAAMGSGPAPAAGATATTAAAPSSAASAIGSSGVSNNNVAAAFSGGGAMHPLSSASSSPRHADPLQRSTAGGVAPRPAAPITVAAATAKNGWDDDDDDDDGSDGAGWGDDDKWSDGDDDKKAPARQQQQQQPLAPQTMGLPRASHHQKASTTTLSAPSSGMSLSRSSGTGSPRERRKLGGGLGAQKLN